LPVVLSFGVLRVTGSVGKLGLVLACQSAVALAFTLAGGVAGDRFSRGRIMVVSLAVRMVVATVLAVALVAGTGSFGLLLAMAGVYGCADGFFSPVSAALLPEVVPRVQLGPANALIGGTTSSASALAPAIAGVVVGVLGPGAGFAFQAVALAVAVGCLAVARLPDGGTGPALRPGVFSDLRAGWTQFARLRWLWLLTGQWTVFSLVVLAPVAVLGPAIAERYLGGALAWGVISSCLSLGAIGGQVIAGRIGPAARPALVIACLVPVMTGEALALGLGAPLALVAAAAVVSGLAAGVQAVIFPTAMQTSVPPEVLSRVTSMDLLASEGGQPVGYALAGPTSGAVGAHAFLTAGAAGMLVASVAFTLVRPLRVRVVPYERPRG
jgi:MFS family permease